MGDYIEPFTTVAKKQAQFDALQLSLKKSLAAKEEALALLSAGPVRVAEPLKDEALKREEAALKREEAVRHEALEAQRKFSLVISQLKGEGATPQGKLRPGGVDTSSATAGTLDPDNPRAKRVGANLLSESTTVTSCSFSVEIHEDPEVFLEALLGDNSKVGKTLFQQVIEEGVAYWSFMVNNTKSCDLLLRMRVERWEEAGAMVRVESVEEEGESGDEGRKKEWGRR